MINLFLELISKLKKKVLLSTGMSTFNEIKRAFNILKKNIKKEKDYNNAL